MREMKIILGSGSKGRREILAEMGYEFEVMVSDIDEKAIRFDDAEKLTLALAHAKADALLSKIEEPALLVTSDQVVLWRGEIREKAESREQLRKYLKSYHRAPAETITSVVVTNTLNGKRKEGVDIAKVYMFKIPDRVIERFLKKGDFLSCAGGFSITDPILGDYVERIMGSMDSVIGLPKELTGRLISEAEKC